jgi:DNA-binding MarR family transcriptional regulator
VTKTDTNVDVDVQTLAASLERLVAMVRRLTPPSAGLSLTASSTLRSLELSGPHRLSELATGQGITQPAMTQLVTRLEREGYVQRGGSPDDARVVLVTLTAAGRDLLHRRRRARSEALHALLDRLPAADREAVFAAVPALNLLAELGQPDDRSRNR